MATDERVMQSQPRGGGFFGQMFANRFGIDLGARQRKRQQEVVSRVFNEEIEAGVGDSTNVDLQKVLPEAYFNAARRIAALGNATEAQQLYSAGMQSLQTTSEHAAKLAHLRAQANDLDEAPTEYLETMRKRDALAAQVAKFPEGTPTGDAIRRQVTELDERLEILNSRAAAAGGEPDRIIQLARQFDADREAGGGKPGTAEQIWLRERDTSSRAQDYAKYVQAEQAAGRKPVPYDQWTPSFQSQLSASTTLGEVGMKRLDEEEQTAQQSVASIGSIKNSLDLLRSGLRTGTLAGVRQSVARAMATFLGDDPSAETVNTDTYVASAAPRVVEIVRALAPVTDQDKAYIQQAVGGELSAATPEALAKILEIAYRTQAAKIQRYNDRLSELGDTYQDVAGVFDPIDVPQVDFSAPSQSTVIKYDSQGRRVQ